MTRRSFDEIINIARIERCGAVILGEDVACDQHYKIHCRVVTHAHNDHIYGLMDSLKECRIVAMTPATMELIRAIYGIKLEPYTETMKNSFNVITLNIGEDFDLPHGTMIFKDACHILGSVQVIYEGKGYVVGYTGDILYPGAEPIKGLDAMVLEATYGSPFYIRPPRKEIEKKLVELVKGFLDDGLNVHVFGYYGKLEKAMEILSRSIDAPMLADNRVYRSAEVHIKHGCKIRNLHLPMSENGLKIHREGGYIWFHHRRRENMSVGEKGVKVILSGWLFNVPFKKKGERTYVVALSDHADFNGLISYVRDSSPGVVITDAYRVGDARRLAHEITEMLGIEAFPMP